MVKVDIEASIGDFRLRAKWHLPDRILVITGPSGAGKTTTLRAIAGLITPQKGEIRLNGTVLFSHSRKINLPPQKRKVGYLPQNQLLFPHMNVYKNITYGKPLENQWIDYVIEKTHTGHLLDKYPHQLSGGEAQRVAIARALATRPSILLLDEPLSNLDRSLREEIIELIREIATNMGIKVVMVTHLLEEVKKIAHKIVEYKRGWGVEE